MKLLHCASELFLYSTLFVNLVGLGGDTCLLVLA